MLRYFITISFVFFSLSVFSQVSQENFEIKISKPYKVIDAPNKEYFSDGKEILLVKWDNTRIILQKFNAETLEMSGSKEILNLPFFSCEKIVQSENKLYFFYSVWDKPNITEQLFVKEIDFKNCDISSEGSLLLKVKGHIAGDPLAYVEFGIPIGIGTKFHINLSDDKRKILVQYRIKPIEKDNEKNTDVIGLYLFDQACNKIGGGETKMPYLESKMDNIDYLVTNNAEVFALITVIDLVKKEGNEGHHEVLKMDLNSGQFKTTEVHLEDVYCGFTKICEDPLHKIICLGHHSQNPYSSQGISFVKMNPNGNIIDTKTFYIPAELRNKKDENISIKKPVISTRINARDSGMVVLEEQVWTEMVGSGQYAHHVYYYEDIFISKITSYGKLEWVKRIPKMQAGAHGESNLSYVYFYNSNYLFVLFLENKSNILLDTKDDMKRLIDGKGGYLVAYKTNLVTGETEKIPLFDITSLNQMDLLQFSPKRFCQINESEFVMEAYKGGKQDILIKIHFN